MTTVYYSSRKLEQLPELGIPYTWGTGDYYYVRVTQDITICLNNQHEAHKVTFKEICSLDDQHTITMSGFRYAQSLEIK